MKHKPAPALPAKPAAGRISRYQRYLAQEGTKGGAGKVPAKAADKGKAGDSYQIIAEAIRVMLREP